jgi:hypothetical protein
MVATSAMLATGSSSLAKLTAEHSHTDVMMFRVSYVNIVTLRKVAMTRSPHGSVADKVGGFLQSSVEMSNDPMSEFGIYARGVTASRHRQSDSHPVDRIPRGSPPRFEAT